MADCYGFVAHGIRGPSESNNGAIMAFKHFVTSTLARAGVSINGQKPWDIQVLRDRF